MNEQIFPPSPNWYLSSAFSCNSSGVLAYGNRNNLVIVKTDNCSKTTLPKVEIIPNAHKERVTVVIFSPHTIDSKLLSNCVATAGDDAVVKVWNLDTMAPILAHVSHGTDSKLCCMDWSRANPDLIVSMDDNNNIVCWDLPSNSTHTINCGKLSASTLSCCPLNKDLIAIGSRSGLVCIINIQGRGKIIYRMRGHDSEVVSLAWCPVGHNIFEVLKGKSEKKEGNNELLLASAAKEKTIFIWRANTDGRYETVLSIPTHFMADKRSNKGSAGDMNWVSLCWPQPYNIICSTRLGRIISWDLKASFINKATKSVAGGDSSSKALKPLHSSHSRIIFGIVSSRVESDMDADSTDSENWRQTQTSEADKPLVVWSSSQDRLIIGYDIIADKEIVNIPTIGGIVYCIAASPIDPNRIAFGVSDAVIRVWNLSSSSPFDITLLWQKIRDKVTSIAWHPTQENKLAFGTAQGRVGIFDSLNTNKPPILFRPYHTKCLYVVTWGPPLFGAGEGDGPSETKYTLYSCGEGNIVQYDIHNPEAEPKNINDLSQLNLASRKSLIRTDLAWKPDNSILALGSEDGSVQIVSSSKGTLLHTIYAHKNLVQSLAWHPEGTATDTGYSPCQHWLAIASKKSPIKVFNLSPLLEGEGNGEVECVAVFSQHKQCVVGMAWSPHISGQLVSVSFDETAQVWDVLRQQPVGNYHYHVGVLHSCCWSPVDPDLILTGSADSTLRVWRISTLDRSLPLDQKKERNASRKAQNVQYSTKNISHSSEKDQPPEENGNSCQMPSSAIATRESESQQAKVVRQKARSFFPVWAQMWQGSVSNILDRLPQYLSEDASSQSSPNLLGDRASVLKLLELEENQHIHNANVESIQHMALWKGDIGEMIRDVARKKKLSDWLVSLAPMVSQRLWMDTCQMYAEQLAMEGRIHKAASYLLACHKVEEAIQLFLQHHLYREALTVAKLRLSPEDPFISSIARTWSQQLISEGHYEKGAECLLSVRDLNGAAEMLGRRNDTRCLWMAAEIAAKGESESMSKCYAKNCILQCLLHKTWDLALKVTSEYLELQPLTVLIFTHKCVNELLTGKIAIDDPLPDWIQQQYKTEYDKDPTGMYVSLERFVEKNVPDTKSRLWLSVSGEVAQSCCSSNAEVKFHHLVRAANICYQYQLMHPSVFPLLQFLRWLAPQDLIDGKIIFKEESSNETVALLQRSLRFYFYAGYFTWLQSEITSNSPNLDPTQDHEEDMTVNSTEPSNLIKETSRNVEDKKENTSTVDKSLNSQLEQIGTLSGNACEETNDNKKDHSPKLNWNDLMIPVLISYSKEIMLESPVIAYYKLQVEIKQWEQEVASLVAQKHHCSVEKANKDSTSDVEKDENSMLKGLQKLDDLKEKKEEFERQRGSAPNPFVTYCHFRNICDYLIREKNMDSLKNVSETAAEHWLSITTGI